MTTAAAQGQWRGPAHPTAEWGWEGRKTSWRRRASSWALEDEEALLGEELIRAFQAEGTASGFWVPLAAWWGLSQKSKPQRLVRARATL